MKTLDGVDLRDLQECMRPVLIAAEDVWRELGRAEGVTVTCTGGGLHSAGSLHYYGKAVDLRTHYWDTPIVGTAANMMRERLGDDYDVVLEKTHIHVEYDPEVT